MREFLCEKLFIYSADPVKFIDLAEANAAFNEGMLIDPAKLHFRFNYRNLIIIYALLCALVLLPLLALTHWAFEKLDFHISLLSAVCITAAVFVCFDAFKIYARRLASARQIRAAWQAHLGFFDYAKHNKLFEEIYQAAAREKIPSARLEQYILERLIERS